MEKWRKLPASTRQRIWFILLSSTAILAASNILRGSLGLLLRDPNDLKERYDEWRLFSEGIYPAFRLANEQERSLAYFRSTVYLPWALPMFGIFFTPAGLVQGKIIIFFGSVSSLLVTSLIGWITLRPFGRNAGLLGSLTPLAIMGNMPAIFLGQFSIICAGALSIQWLLLTKNNKWLPGLLWSLAMIKPQIAFFYALPFLRLKKLTNLVTGTCVLLLLSVIALNQTQVSPAELASQWLNVLNYFASNHNLNIASNLLPVVRGVSLWLSISLLTAGSCIATYLVNKVIRHLNFSDQSQSVTFAGICSILGYVSFYHVHYDKIMLYPALLACFSLSFRKTEAWRILLSVLLAATAWLPHRLLEALPGSREIQLTIWIAAGIVLSVNLLSQLKQIDNTAI